MAVTADSGRAPAEETSSCARSLVMMTTVASAAVLISALTASQRPWVPNIRFKPGNGLNFFSVGFIALGGERDAALRRPRTPCRRP